MCYTQSPAVARSWEQGARISVLRWLVSLRKGCVGSIDNATDVSAFMSSIWATGIPEGCDFAAVIRTNGTIYMTVDFGATWILLFDPATVGGTQPSIIEWWAGAVGGIPSDWLVADGQEVSRATYADLFAIIGTTYGIGDGSTTFNLPDLRAISPMGVNDGTLDSIDGALATRANADITGTETHTLTEAEIASHQHTTENTTTSYDTSTNSDGVKVGAINTGSTGGDTAHENIQVSIVLYPIIKT